MTENKDLYEQGFVDGFKDAVNRAGITREQLAGMWFDQIKDEVTRDLIDSGKLVDLGDGQYQVAS